MRDQKTEKFHTSTEAYSMLLSFNRVVAIGFGDTTIE